MRFICWANAVVKRSNDITAVNNNFFFIFINFKLLIAIK